MLSQDKKIGKSNSPWSSKWRKELSDPDRVVRGVNAEGVEEGVFGDLPNRPSKLKNAGGVERGIFNEFEDEAEEQRTEYGAKTIRKEEAGMSLVNYLIKDLGLRDTKALMSCKLDSPVGRKAIALLGKFIETANKGYQLVSENTTVRLVRQDKTETIHPVTNIEQRIGLSEFKIKSGEIIPDIDKIDRYFLANNAGLRLLNSGVHVILAEEKETNIAKLGKAVGQSRSVRRLKYITSTDGIESVLKGLSQEPEIFGNKFRLYLQDGANIVLHHNDGRQVAVGTSKGLLNREYALGIKTAYNYDNLVKLEPGKIISKIGGMSDLGKTYSLALEQRENSLDLVRITHKKTVFGISINQQKEAKKCNRPFVCENAAGRTRELGFKEEGFVLDGTVTHGSNAEKIIGYEKGTQSNPASVKFRELWSMLGQHGINLHAAVSNRYFQ